MLAALDVLESLTTLGITVEARGDSLRYRPTSAMTPELLAAVKNHKSQLLRLLTKPASHADREWDRFFACAIPTPNGLGLYDPSESPEMPSGYVVPHPSERPAGVPRGWTPRSWVQHLKYMGNACAALNPEQSADYLSKAEQLEDCNV